MTMGEGGPTWDKLYFLLHTSDANLFNPGPFPASRFVLPPQTVEIYIPPIRVEEPATTQVPNELPQPPAPSFTVRNSALAE